MRKSGIFKYTTVIVVVALVIGFLIAGNGLVEELEADQIMVIQYPVTGKLTVHTAPGMKLQLFGKVTKYPRAFTYEFDPDLPGGYEGLDTRFNDAAEGNIEGSLRVQFPLDATNIIEMHKYFGSHEGVIRGLIKPNIDKNVLVVGTLMNSQESLAEKRSSIIRWIEDMANNGIYSTRSVETVITDILTGEEKTATAMEIVIGPDGTPERTEDSKLAEYGITVDNMSISEIKYGDKVIAQIDRRREAQMEVETAIAEAKKAEQRALTVEQEGRANAAKAKWDQEVVKAQQITEAEQRREVAKLDKEAAEFEKQRQILLGQGEAERKRLVMNADGALDKKLEAWKYAQNAWAAAAADYQGNWVPQVSMGGGETGNGINGAQAFMDLLSVRAAKDLSLDLSIPSTSGK